MAKLTEKKTETEKATEALSGQFDALNIIARNEQEKKESVESAENGKKGRKDKLVTFNIPPEDADKYKKWFGSKGISLSMGIRMCLDYIYYQDQMKKVILTKSGIRENELLNLK
jgi:hypothetical protein